MFRLSLRLLPLWTLMAFDTAGDAGVDPEPDDDSPDDPDTARFSQADVDAIFAKRLERERRKLREELAADIRKDIEAEAKRKQAVEREEFKTLYEDEQAKREAAELKAEQAEAEYKKRTKERIVRAEVKVAAAELGFIKPDIAYRLIDLDEVSYGDNDGEPKNIKTLVNRLAKDHPYLVHEEGTRPVTHSRSNGRDLTKTDRVNQILAQVGQGPLARRGTEDDHD